ncbi:MAG TPA: hypothetical protein VFC68_05055, partial [Treponemataceae bacterium]|nr:hypothetical protein [Treponemataceae bacterium]
LDSEKIIANNVLLYNELTINPPIYPFSLELIDLFKGDKGLGKKQGVGYARRYGMDWAAGAGAELLACMDADTLVSTDYARELFRFLTYPDDFSNSFFSLCQFSHQKIAKDYITLSNREYVKNNVQNAIDSYEHYIKEHSTQLKKTGTPYWPYALGPTIVCRVKAYVGVGGMPKRLAGEDFYFLQALIKYSLQKGCKFITMLNTCVYPESRLSDRVPFGTGPALKTALLEKKIPSVYLKDIYDSISGFISVVKNEIYSEKSMSSENILSRMPHKCTFFLEQEKFAKIWHKLTIENKKSPKKMETAFHVWFDGLKIIRLIHYLE